MTIGPRDPGGHAQVEVGLGPGGGPHSELTAGPRPHPRQEGLRIRFRPIRGITPRRILDRPLYLPALLNEWTIEEEGAHVDYETVSAGEFSIPQYGPERNRRKLRTSDLEALTLFWDAPWLHESHQDPDWIERKLFDILRAKKPVEALARIFQPGWSDTTVRMLVTFRNVRETVKPGEPDTRYWQVQTKEWARQTTHRRAVSHSRGRRHGEGIGEELPTTARLDSDDTLRSLSKHYYGRYDGWRAIARANRIRGWGGSTPLIKSKRFKVGDRLKIPSLGFSDAAN